MRSAWQVLWRTLARNPISFFAVLCVAIAAVYLASLTDRMLDVLTSEAWCGKAIQAERISPGQTYVGLTTCVELLKIQLQAVATGFHISVGAYAFSLVVLVVVVIAGARASVKVGAGGLEGSVGKDAAAGAEHVEKAAEKAAAEVKDGQAPQKPGPPGTAPPPEE